MTPSHNPRQRSLVSKRIVLVGGALAAVGLLGCAGPFCTTAWADESQPRSLAVMKRDGSNVRGVIQVEGFPWLGWPRWSHDGKRLAFDARKRSADTVRSFVVNADGTGLADLGSGAQADWSPDDKQLAFTAEANASTKAGIWVQNTDGLGRQWLAAGTAPRWSPDGSQIAHLAGTLRILDLADGSARELLEAGRRIKTARPGFDWSPDGSRLAAAIELGDGRGEVVIVKTQGSPGEIRTRLQGAANDVAWSPDGKTLAVSLRDEKLGEHRIHLLSADGQDAPLAVPGQQGDNRQAAWSPDGALLAFVSSRAAGGSPLAAAAARPDTLELVRAHDKGGTVYSLGLAPDGRTAFVGGDLTHRGLQVWDTQTGDVVRHIDSRGIFVAVAPDGRHAASAEILGGDVQYLDLEDGALIREFTHGSPVTSLQFSGDGSRLVTAGVDKNACVFDVASGERRAQIAHPDELKQVAFSPDGKSIAATCNDKKLYLWNAASGRKLRDIEHPAVPWAVAFSPDGRHVMTGTGGVLVGKRSDMNIQPEDDNTLRIWDVESGKLLRQMNGHTHTIASAAYAPDGKQAVSGSFDHSLRLWDVESGELLSRVDGQGWVTKVVFSFDGRQVLASGGAEKVFDQRRWQEFPDERVRLFKIVSARH